jgi:hypothetical protein
LLSQTARLWDGDGKPLAALKARRISFWRYDRPGFFYFYGRRITFSPDGRILTYHS